MYKHSVYNNIRIGRIAVAPVGTDLHLGGRVRLRHGVGVRRRGRALQRHGHGRVRRPGRRRRMRRVVRQTRHVRGVAGVRRVCRVRGVCGVRGVVQWRWRTIPRGPLSPPRAAHAADGRLFAV